MTDPITPEQEAASRGYSPEQAALIGGLERLLEGVPVHVSIPILILTLEACASELQTVPARFHAAALLRESAKRLENIGRLGGQPTPKGDPL